MILPDSEETRIIFEPRARREDLAKAWIMKGGEMADVMYIFS